MVLLDGVRVENTTKGACCKSNPAGGCEMLEPADCRAINGRFSTTGQLCENTLCCPLIYGDSNFDASVDMQDFGTLQRCLTTGSTIPLAEECICFDFNNDQEIDTSDIAHFADCATGPGDLGSSTGPCKGTGW